MRKYGVQIGGPSLVAERSVGAGHVMRVTLLGSRDTMNGQRKGGHRAIKERAVKGFAYIMRSSQVLKASVNDCEILVRRSHQGTYSPGSVSHLSNMMSCVLTSWVLRDLCEQLMTCTAGEKAAMR